MSSSPIGQIRNIGFKTTKANKTSDWLYEKNKTSFPSHFNLRVVVETSLMVN